jgi:hypothetical protein
MTTPRRTNYRRALTRAITAFAVYLVVFYLLQILSWWLEGSGFVPFDPILRLVQIDQTTASEVLSNAAEVIAGVLAMAVTVVAIVVELAANRYNHRITTRFVSEPINVIVVSGFMLTAVQCLWFATTESPTEAGPHGAFAMTMIMVTMSLLALLPYFFFVFSFLSPVSMVEKIRLTALATIEATTETNAHRTQHKALEAVDELHDVARSAAQVNDRDIAMASIDAMTELVLAYQTSRKNLPRTWFNMRITVAGDPDFVPLAPTAFADIESRGLWFEVKVFRQFLTLMSQGTAPSRDIANLIAINTERIGKAAAVDNPDLLDLCIRCFNSYLRTTISRRDPRSAYYIMNQYRLLAEELLAEGLNQAVREIARHFQFYGILGYQLDQTFLLEVAAHDLAHLIEKGYDTSDSLTDGLTSLLLELDQEIRNETQEESLLSVRRAQIQVATFFLERGDVTRAHRIRDDLLTEAPHRLRRVVVQLEHEDRPQYWEFTDRGVNFGYLIPSRRKHLAEVLNWLT